MKIHQSLSTLLLLGMPLLALAHVHLESSIPARDSAVSASPPKLAAGDCTVNYTYVGPDEHKMSSSLKLKVATLKP